MCVGGLVSAHSVKLLDKINNPDEPLTRDAWWHELRSEVRQHARALCCNAVIGYSETTSIWLVGVATALRFDPSPPLQ